MEYKDLSEKDLIILSQYIFNSMGENAEIFYLDRDSLDIHSGIKNIPQWVIDDPENIRWTEYSIKCINKYFLIPYNEIINKLKTSKDTERGVYLFRLEKGI